MSSAKAYVLQYFPDAYHDQFLDGVIIFTNKKSISKSVMAGSGDTEEQAWEDAKQWIEQLSEEDKPKIVSHE